MGRRLRGLVRVLTHLFTDYHWTFGIILVVTVVSTAVSIQYLTALEARIQDVYENDVRGGDSVQAAAVALLALENAIKDARLADHDAARRAANADQLRQREAVSASLRRAAPRFYTPKAKQALEVAQADWKQVVAALDAGDVDAALARSERLEADLGVLIANRTANSSKGITDLLTQLRWSLVFTIVVLLVTVVVRVLLYWAGHPSRRRGDSDSGPQAPS